VLGAVQFLESSRQVFVSHEARLPCLDISDLLIELGPLFRR
jgi:hypothetical protein